MNKLEVGMYVRFKYPRHYVPIQISKIKSKEYDELEKYYSYITDNNLVIIEEQIIKEPSYNIIDLIEEGDLLKIEYYSLRYEERVIRLFEVTYKDERYMNLVNGKCDFMLVNGEFNKSDKELNPVIKSIVTKEQFENMEYEVSNE